MTAPAPDLEGLGARAAFALDGHVVVVTGAGRGIGRDIALAASGAGATVVACSRTEAELESLAAEIDAGGGVCHTVRVDLNSPDAAHAVVEFAVERCGRIDGFVNNAGNNTLRPALEYSVEEVDALLDLNLRSVYWCCIRAGEQLLRQEGGGCIVNITSQAGVVGAPGRAPYSAAKAGVNNLTRTLAAEWARHPVRVNAVAPTVTSTPLGERVMQEQPAFAEEVRERILLGRPASVREVSLPVLFLLSPAASMITGHVLVVDGGWTIV